ncbi:methyl-accepting chemotaxis protein [Paenibacillus brevis]|uniref:Methyl-accepting chemotaxis protein n=1 Tax=Paenibacillus brevis TaxID=2841508 RepID=A0ABS6FVY1_9BACL|nr:methyl-accepting chemotaxis protein [Paenibacillus brevis]MBU5674382.1 methyl-accepting chemotaxis protein [Paenibacillus brevis]
MGMVPKKKEQDTDSKESKQKGLNALKGKLKPPSLEKAGGGWKSSVGKMIPGQINPSKSVGVRLFLIFFVAIMTFVLAIGLMSYGVAKNTIQRNAETSNTQTILQTTQKLDIVFQKFADNLQQAFLDDEMQKAITEAYLPGLSDYDRFTQVTKMRTRLNGLTFSNDGFTAIYMLSSKQAIDDISAGNTDPALLGTIRDTEWFKEVSEKTTTQWMPVPKEDGSTPEVFRLVRSVQSVTSMERFVLVADIKLKVLEDYLKEVSLGDGSEVKMMTADNFVVSSSNTENVGLTDTIDMSKAGTESYGSFITKDQSGESVLAVFVQHELTGWKLVGTVATSELTKDAKSILSYTFLSALIVAFITILIAFWMVRMIAHPLGKMKELMEEGAKGNLNVRMETRAKDEIGQLSISFNLMMEQITSLVSQTNHSAQDVLETAAELTDASNKTAISAREIASATEEIANGATSLANEAERGNSLTDNIARQMEHVISVNQQMEHSAHQVHESSQRGTEYLNGLLDKTEASAEMISQLTNKVDELKTSTSSVMKVLDVMKNITQQTNILSLNATIEAARAGAAGRGFMVVADEIRQLADQSKQSIAMVGEITDNIQKEMNETVQALSEASPLFQEQMSSVKETGQIFVSVQQQMDNFITHLDKVTSSIDQLNESQNILSDAMSNVSAVAEESSATSEEVASLSSEQQTIGEQLVQLSKKLENVSTGLKDSLSKFTV